MTTPSFSVHRIFTKNISLEMPAGAEVFRTNEAPNTDIAIQVSKTLLADNVYEVALRGTVTGKKPSDNKPLYLLEVEQAGIFEVKDANEQQLADILDISIPGILNPYLRAMLADMLTRGTLPVLFLPDINWVAMAADSRAKAAGAAADAEFTPA